MSALIFVRRMIEAGWSEAEALRAAEVYEATVAEVAAGKRPKKSKPAASKIDPLWRPSEEECRYAYEKGFSPDETDWMASDFVSYFAAKGTRWANWKLVWMRWVRKQVERRGQNGQSTYGQSGPSAGASRNARAVANLHEGALEALNQRRRQGNDEPPDFF